MKTIAVTNQKGGVGKTTTAVNLSAALAQQGKRVLLIDLDPQASATSVVGDPEDSSPGLYQALIGAQRAEDLVRPTRINNLSLIKSSLDLAGAEIEVAKMERHLMQLHDILQGLRREALFDFTFMDCPPSVGILMLNALAAADEILLPIQCEYYALEGLGLLMQVTTQIRESGANPKLAISGMVMTMYDSRTNLNAAVARDVREHFQEVVYDTVIPRTIRFGEAPSHGKTILEYDPLGPGAHAYRALAAEFLRRQSSGVAFAYPAVPAPASP